MIYNRVKPLLMEPQGLFQLQIGTLREDHIYDPSHKLLLHMYNAQDIKKNDKIRVTYISTP